MTIPPVRSVGDPNHTVDHNGIRQELIDLNTEVDSKADATHTHTGTDIASGTVPAARLGSGAATGRFLRADSTWQPITTADIPHVHDADDVTAGVFATGRLGTGTANQLTFLRGDGTWATPPAGGSGAPGAQVITVAASNSPAAIKARCDYVCTGANDHTVINTALTTAANQVGGTGTRQSSVLLADGDYSLGGPVLIPNRGLSFGGTSKLTRLFRGSNVSNFTGPGSGNVAALIKFADTEEARSAVWVKIHTMRLDGLGQAAGCSGIYLDMAGQGAVYNPATYGQPDSSPDHNILIEGVSTIYTPYGIYINGSSSVPRVTKILNCHAQNFGVMGIGGNNASDAKVVSCTTQGGQSNNAIGFQTLGGNCEFTACKAAYASTGNPRTTGGIGFNITSPRALLSGCVSQDNPFGINVTDVDCLISGFKIDTQEAETRGAYIGADRCIVTGLQITVRGGTIARGLEFSSASHDHMVDAYIQGSSDITKKVCINNGSEITDPANLPRGLYRIRVSGDPGTSLVR